MKCWNSPAQVHIPLPRVIICDERGFLGSGRLLVEEVVCEVGGVCSCMMDILGFTEAP